MTGGRLRQPLLSLARSLWLQPLWEGLDRAIQRARNFESVDLDRNGEADLLRRLSAELRHQVIVDVGANHGHWARTARDAVGRCTIHAFEPSTAAFEQLAALDGIFAHRLALGASPGRATLHTAEPGASIASLIPLAHPIRPFDPRNAEEVDVTTLDAFCGQQDITRIALLKIDVEGGELDVLKGAAALLAANAIDRVQFEFGAAHIDSRTFLRDILNRLGAFDVFRIMPRGLLPLDYRPRDERFETANYLAVRKGMGRR